MSKITFLELRNSGYSYPPSVDAATTSLIDDWFAYRLCDDTDKFKLFFNRCLELNIPYYEAMLRVDPSAIEIDWFVENYSERQKTGETATNNAESTTSSNTRTDTGKIENTSTMESLSINNNNSDTLNAAYNRARALSRTSPMSASYTDKEMKANDSKSVEVGINKLEGYAADMPDLHITNPSATTDGLTETGSAATVVNVDKASTQAENTSNTTNTVTSVGTLTDSKTAGGNAKSLEREIYSGRSATPADIIAKAKNVIMGTNAWQFLYHKLDTCFYSCYTYEED